MFKMMLLTAFTLAGCSADIQFGPRRAAPVAPPPGSTAVIEPNGEEVIGPTAIETVITGLSQAQAVRTLTRQLAR